MKRLILKRFIRQSARNNKKERVLCSPKPGVKIGILFDANETGHREAVEKLREQLISMGAEVSALGYFALKEFPEKLIFKPGFDYYNKKETDWKGGASHAIVEKLNGSKLNILIACTLVENLPMLQLMAQSNAGFRLGPYLEKYTDCFDFMIETKANQDMNQLTGSYLRYLKQIKS